MRRIGVEDGRTDGAPKFGEIQPDLRPPPVLRLLIFAFFAFLRDVEKVISRTITSDESYFWQKGHSDGAPAAGGIQSDFAHF